MLNITQRIQFNHPINLSDTIESGQTFLWRGSDGGNLFGTQKNDAYHTCRYYDDELVAIRVSQDDSNELLVRSNSPNGTNVVEHIFGKDKYNIDAIQQSLIERDTDDGVVTDAIQSHSGLRLLNEPFFPTLVSFICSTQMRVERIHSMVQGITEQFGTKATDGYYAFPTPEQLSKATEEQLQDLGLGYRAEYVHKTLSQYDPTVQVPQDTDEARNFVKQYMGVGSKVADCVLLYGLNHTNVVPVDTWIDTAVEKHYPSLYSDSTEQISANLQSQFGEWAGYAQLYLFQYTRPE